MANYSTVHTYEYFRDERNFYGCAHTVLVMGLYKRVDNVLGTIESYVCISRQTSSFQERDWFRWTNRAENPICTMSWPSGLRRHVKAVVFIGVGSNPTDIILLFWSCWDLRSQKSIFCHSSCGYLLCVILNPNLTRTDSSLTCCDLGIRTLMIDPHTHD